MIMKNKRILVTGGAGYIGSHTVVEICNAGYEPVIVDNLSNSSLEVLEGIKKITGKEPVFREEDCTDYLAMERVFKEFPDISLVIHFAAYKAVGESVQKPLDYYLNNIGSLVNILRLLSVKGGDIVFSSSCTVYGQPDDKYLPVSEDAPIKKAESPYGNTKQICEEIIADTVRAESGRVKAISLRYFNPVGAHPSAHIGELPRGVPQNLLPFVTQTAAGLREELKVFGNDYNTPDGSCVRDYIYVCDLAKAHVAAADRLLSDDKPDENFEVFNLGTGKGLSVLEVIDMFRKANGVDVPFSIAPRRAGDVEKVWADPSKANRVLGWNADTSFEDVMRSAWKWEKKIRGI